MSTSDRLARLEREVEQLRVADTELGDSIERHARTIDALKRALGKVRIRLGFTTETEPLWAWNMDGDYAPVRTEPAPFEFARQDGVVTIAVHPFTTRNSPYSQVPVRILTFRARDLGWVNYREWQQLAAPDVVGLRVAGEYHDISLPTPESAGDLLSRLKDVMKDYG